MRRVRNAYRLASPESLEERQVLSGSGGGIPVFSQLQDNIAHLLKLSTSQKAAPPTFATIGDSLTDEYVEYAPDRSQARNWVELLAATGKGNFGRYSKSSLGEPRDVGYAGNWARSDAETGDAVANQLPGVVNLVKQGKVRYVSVIIGDNDFGAFLQQAATAPSSPATVVANLMQVEAKAQANFDTIANTLLAANPRVRLVVGTIPDLTLTPLAKAQLAPFGAQGQLLAGLASQAIGAYNAHIQSFAAGNPRVALADLAAGTVEALSKGPTTRFGGATIDIADPGDDYHNFFLADGYHPGTVGQGLIANTIVRALDTRFHAGIRPLSDAQIVRRAAIARRFP